MKRIIIIGIVLGGATIVVDRYFHKLPDWLAIVLFTIACIMIIAGMVITRESA